MFPFELAFPTTRSSRWRWYRYWLWTCRWVRRSCVSKFFTDHFPWSVSGNPWLDSKNISSYDGDVNDSEWSIIYVYCGSMLYIISAIRITGIGLCFYQLKKRMINLHLLIVLSLKTIVSKNLSCLTWNWADTSHIYRLRTSDIFMVWRGDIPSYKPK